MAEDVNEIQIVGKLQPRIISISHSSDVIVARNAAKAMASSLGFDEKVSDEVALVMNELATNLLRHATAGLLLLAPLNDELRVGIKIESRDKGPGIADIEAAMTDGFSTIGSLGYGLGTVNRLMDEFDITSPKSTDEGTHVICKKWKYRNDLVTEACPFDIGAATRQHPKMNVNGDTFVIKKFRERLLVAIIDGLGHGQFAHRAAQKARQYVEDHSDMPLVELFRSTGRSCRATRGVVMAIARFDWKEEKLSFASIGNIEARVFGSPTPMSLVVRRGVIGINAPNPVVSEYHWEPFYIMVLHTDGLSVHWKWDDFPNIANEHATFIAQQFLHKLAKDQDDAAVIVVKGRKSR